MTKAIRVDEVVSATEVLEGKARLATQAEVDARVDDTTIVTPFKLPADVDITGKADKVQPVVSGDLAELDANGNLVDSGLRTVNVVSHLGDQVNNPHKVNKSDVVLYNVDNTSDLDKPVSTATQTALDSKEGVLGNPTTDGHILSSTIAGVRSWVAQGVSKLGDLVSGTLTVAVPTATESALVLQSTDDNTTYPLALLKNLSGDTVAKIDADGVISQYYDTTTNPTVRSFLSPRELSLSNSNNLENARIFTEGYDLKVYTRSGIKMYSNDKESLVINEDTCYIGNTSTNTHVHMRFGTNSIIASPNQLASSSHMFIGAANDTQRTGVYQTLSTGNNPMFEFVVGFLGNIAAEFDHEGDLALGHNRSIAKVSHKLKSDTTEGQDAFRQETSWIVSTHGSRQAVTKLFISDWNGEHETLTLEAKGASVNNLVKISGVLDITVLDATTAPLNIRTQSYWLRLVSSSTNCTFQFLTPANTGVMPFGIDADSINLGRGDVSIIGTSLPQGHGYKARLYIKGQSSNSSTNSLLAENFDGDASFIVKDSGVINMPNLPISITGLVAGDLWNNAGVINIV